MDALVAVGVVNALETPAMCIEAACFAGGAAGEDEAPMFERDSSA